MTLQGASISSAVDDYDTTISHLVLRNTSRSTMGASPTFPTSPTSDVVSLSPTSTGLSPISIETTKIYDTPIKHLVPHPHSPLSTRDISPTSQACEVVSLSPTTDASPTIVGTAESTSDIFVHIKSPYTPLYAVEEMGWKIHITCSNNIHHASKLVKFIAPILETYRVYFKVVANKMAFAELFSNSTQAGKLITLYPCRNFTEDAFSAILQAIDEALINGCRTRQLDARLFMPLTNEVRVGSSGALYGRFGTCNKRSSICLDDRTKPWPAEKEKFFRAHRPFPGLALSLYKPGCLWGSWYSWEKLFPKYKSAKVAPALPPPPAASRSASDLADGSFASPVVTEGSLA